MIINRKGSQRVQSIVRERFRRRGLCLHGKSMNYCLQHLHSLVLLLRELFSGHVESNVSLQCSVGRLIIVGDCLQWFRKSSVATIVCSLVDLKQVYVQQEKEVRFCPQEAYECASRRRIPTQPAPTARKYQPVGVGSAPRALFALGVVRPSSYFVR